jgi:TRAP-type C4-dicarboxylate transport system permease small subunit
MWPITLRGEERRHVRPGRPRRCGRAVNAIEETLIALLLGLMTVVTFANVVARYVFNSNILWALERRCSCSPGWCCWARPIAVKNQRASGRRRAGECAAAGARKAWRWSRRPAASSFACC